MNKRDPFTQKIIKLIEINCFKVYNNGPIEIEKFVGCWSRSADNLSSFITTTNLGFINHQFLNIHPSMCRITAHTRSHFCLVIKHALVQMNIHDSLHSEVKAPSGKFTNNLLKPESRATHLDIFKS